MPVHRIPGTAKGRVFAFEAELREWLSVSGTLDQPNRLHDSQSEVPREGATRSNSHLMEKRLAALFVCAALAAAIFAFRSARHYLVHASATTGPAAKKTNSIRPETSQAEDLYLQGRYYWNRRTPDDLNRAVDYFTQAIVRDPNYANAYVGLADSYNLLREYSAMPPSEAYPRALAAASRAVELDDSSADAHLSLAFATFYWSWDSVGAEREFKRALELNPGSARAHHWYATFLLSSQRFPEALTQIEKARSLDPSSVAILADKAEILQESHQTRAAMDLLKQIEAADPNFTSAHRYMAEIYLARKDYPDYLKEWRQTATLLRDQNELEVEGAAEKGFSTGGYEGMQKGILRAQKRLNSQGAVPAFSLAMTYARLGDKQESLQCLRAAYEKHDSSLLFLSTEPAFDGLRGAPEFDDLLGRVSPVLPH
jgi:tetratricopeptide (TPR) repeat protein